MNIDTELLIWALGATLGYQIWRIKLEHPIGFLVAGAIGIGTLVSGLSGELFDNGLLLLVDVSQALVAVWSAIMDHLF
jgi:hypothetical protein